MNGETASDLAGSSKNPAGYFRRAIEDDYLPPPKYQTPAHTRVMINPHSSVHGV